MPSITTWTRLEPRSRDDSLERAVRARLFDPLWLLARQWQMGEFEGEDAGSPVQARWRGVSAPITRVLAGRTGPDAAARAQPYDAAAAPLEAAVERQRIGPVAPFDPASSLRLAVESGLHFLRLLALQAPSRDYRAAFVRRYALDPPGKLERDSLDAETLDYWDLMAGRAPDARLLLASWRAGNGQRLALPADLGILAGDRARVDAAVDAWLAWHGSLFIEPPAGQDAWQRERQEYAFAAGAGLDGRETTLVADEHHGGHLDWHAVDIDPAASLGALADGASRELTRRVIPAPVSFRGAPAQRYWEFEDASVDYGLLPAGPGDLPQLLLSDFATQFGNDWYVIPIELPVGTLTRTRSLVVVDTFGVQTLINPLAPAAADGFAMYALSRRPGAATLSTATGALTEPNLLFLAPTLRQSLESLPREEVLFLRDEMANLAWAVERVVQGRVEQRIDRAAGSGPSDTATPTASTAGTQAADSSADGSADVPHYRLATAVPDNWIPLVPQRTDAGPAGLRLVRAAMLDTRGLPQARPARGLVIGGAPLALYDEEVPREGARVTRGYQAARWIGGRTVVWLAQRKQVGRGEGSSGLAFDGLDEG